MGAFRLGLGAGIGVLSLDRVAEGGEGTWAMTFGLRAMASFDVTRWGPLEEHALFLLLRFQGDLADGGRDAPWVWGPSLGVGVSY